MTPALDERILQLEVIKNGLNTHKAEYIEKHLYMELLDYHLNLLKEVRSVNIAIDCNDVVFITEWHKQRTS